MKTGYKVGQVMTQKVLCTGPGTTIKECAMLMAESGVGSVVICDGDKVIGILTEQDLARRVIAKGLDVNKLVSEVMSTTLYTIETEEDVYDAVVYMGNQRIKHLPVMDNGVLKGIISFKDVIKFQPDLVDLLSFKSSLSKEERDIIFTKP